MALLLKDANGNLVSLANKSDKWAVYNTKAAAEEALANDELAEGMMVGVVSTTETPFNPDYSTAETNTGAKWIDGKPVYRKCYSADGTSSISGVLDTFTNVNIIKIEGMAHISTGVWLPFGFSGANDINARWDMSSTGQLRIEVGSYALWGYNAIVEYTKTGD